MTSFHFSESTHWANGRLHRSLHPRRQSCPWTKRLTQIMGRGHLHGRTYNYTAFLSAIWLPIFRCPKGVLLMNTYWGTDWMSPPHLSLYLCSGGWYSANPRLWLHLRQAPPNRHVPYPGVFLSLKVNSGKIWWSTVPLSIAPDCPCYNAIYDRGFLWWNYLNTMKIGKNTFGSSI